MISTLKFASAISKYAVVACVCFYTFPLSEGLALHCQPYWTAAYKCMSGCGCPRGGGAVQQQPDVPSAAKRADDINSAGVAASNARDFARAARLFEQALRISPGYAPAVINLRNTRAILTNDEGVRAFKAGNYALAVRLFEQALRINPNDASAANNLKMARANMTNSTTTPAVNPAKNPGDVRALNDAGIEAGRAHNWTVAVSLFEQALQIRPNDAVLAKNLRQSRAMVANVEGNIAYALGNFAAAAKVYERALRIDPTNPDRSVIADNLKKARAAIVSNADVLKDAPNHIASQTPNKKQQVADVAVVAAKKVGSELVCPTQLPQRYFAPLRYGHPDATTCWPIDVIPCQSLNKVWSCPKGKSCGDPEAGANGQVADLARKCR